MMYRKYRLKGHFYTQLYATGILTDIPDGPILIEVFWFSLMLFTLKRVNCAKDITIICLKSWHWAFPLQEMCVAFLLQDRSTSCHLVLVVMCVVFLLQDWSKSCHLVCVCGVFLLQDQSTMYTDNPLSCRCGLVPTLISFLKISKMFLYTTWKTVLPNCGSVGFARSWSTSKSRAVNSIKSIMHDFNK